tara:strand:- start:230 stop:1180 length:951 start_codon:yes stop_codon:yes gene_type:complete
MKHLSINLIITILFITACEKQESPIYKHETGEIIISQVELGKNYTQQVYFDLETNAIVSQNNKEDWDLSFESSENGSHILLNSSKAMAIIPFENTAFNQVYFTEQEDWRYDATSGNLDSTAIGDWNNKVILIDRGYSSEGDKIGYSRFTIEQNKEGNFAIKYQNLPEEEIQTYTVKKDKAYHFVQFSFDHGQVQYEPKKNTFDLIFTQYTHLFEENTPYLVTGILTNLKMEIAEINSPDFTAITMDDLTDLEFNNDRNNIGYNWKVYNYDDGTYSIFTEKIYIIKTNESFFYKLHFIDYYNQNGEKGTPTFEFQRL